VTLAEDHTQICTAAPLQAEGLATQRCKRHTATDRRRAPAHSPAQSRSQASPDDLPTLCNSVTLGTDTDSELKTLARWMAEEFSMSYHRRETDRVMVWRVLGGVSDEQ
jgi:hypothetical protein